MVVVNNKWYKSFHAKSGTEVEVILPAWIQEVCCDCKVVHIKMIYRENNKLIIKTLRDDYKTDLLRRVSVVHNKTHKKKNKK